MTIIHTHNDALRTGNKPDWCQTSAAGYFRLANDGGTHDCHYHDYNKLYLVYRGKAKILNAGREWYIKVGDIVCIQAGSEHDILEV